MVRAERGLPQYFVDISLLIETDECIIWPFAKNNDGYAVFKYQHKRMYVSVYICTKVYGPKPTPKHEVAHSCGNGHIGCINKRHIRWATRKENVEDAIQHGRR
jgi:hypothetical protein